MRKIFFKILLIGLAAFLLAGCSTSTTVDSVTQQITDPSVASHTDLSLSYLGQIFGTVTGSLEGTSGQMLGQLFYKFNVAILIIAGFWMSYTVGTMGLRSAQEGSFMGANKNAPVIFLKIAIGLGLLMPNPTTGYSVFQDAVMKVVVSSVALADQTWRFGLDYISNGGTLWRPPAGSAGGITIDSKTTDTILGSVGKTIFQNEVCMYASTLTAGNTSQSNNQDTNPSYNSNGASPTYTFQVDSSTNTVQFYGYGDQQPFSGTGACGSVDYSSIPGADQGPANPSASSAAQSASQQGQNAVMTMAQDLMPAAKEYVCSQAAYSGNSACTAYANTNIASDNGNAFFSALIDYANAVTPIAQLQQEGTAKTAMAFMKQAESDGWLTAGRYYWDLSRIQAKYNAVTNISTYVPGTMTLATAVSGGATSQSDIKAAVQGAGPQVGDTSTLNTYVYTAYGLVQNYTSASKAGGTGGYRGGQVAQGVGMVVGILLGSLIGDIVKLIALFAPGSMGVDPIMFLHQIGMSCISIAGDVFLGSILGVSSLLAAAGVCTGITGLQGWIQGTVDWIKPSLMAMGATFLATGFILGYYIPIYPYMLFTFGVIGWIIAVIEAMIAAPLVCLGLTHPEGHDFLGESKQALMLLLGVFVRPVLMVIGLIAAMILSYVSLRLVNYTYSGFITDIFYTVAPVSGSSTSVLGGAALAALNITAGAGASLYGALTMLLLTFPLMLLIFAGLVYLVTTQCFSLIHVLPDNILRWIGSPTTPSSSAQMAQQMQGIVGSSGTAIGQGMQARAQTTEKERAEEKKKEEKKQAASNTGGGTPPSGT